LAIVIPVAGLAETHEGARKEALVACMRKLLTISNTMVKNGTRWDEKLA
jgi:hypothetical protein